jgi:hypothetical protein
MVKLYPCNSLWKPTRFWDVEAPTFSRQSAHRWWWGNYRYENVECYKKNNRKRMRRNERKRVYKADSEKLDKKRSN